MRSTLITGAAIAIAVTVSLSAVAWAAIPDEEGVIHACRSVQTGLLRVIDTSEDACRPSETPLAWSIGGAGLTSVVVRRAAGQAPGGTPNIPRTAVAACESGEVVTGGGVFPPPHFIIIASAPFNPGVGFPPAGEAATGWVGGVINPSSSTSGFDVFALCAS